LASHQQESGWQRVEYSQKSFNSQFLTTYNKKNDDIRSLFLRNVLHPCFSLHAVNRFAPKFPVITHFFDEKKELFLAENDNFCIFAARNK
jgi:hypothetical protein